MLLTYDPRFGIARLSVYRLEADDPVIQDQKVPMDGFDTI
jgi:hypothetical protein